MMIGWVEACENVPVPRVETRRGKSCKHAVKPPASRVDHHFVVIPKEDKRGRNDSEVEATYK
jgi:hypothetical protein